MTVPGGQTVKPGASTAVQVRISTMYRKGKLNKEIFIVTNDPQSQSVRVIVTANVREVLAIRPTHVNFGIVEPGSHTQREISLTNQGTKTLVIRRTETRPAKQFGLPFAGPVSLAPDESTRLTLNFKAGDKPGRVYGAAIFKVDQGQPLVVSVRLFAQVKPAAPPDHAPVKN